MEPPADMPVPLYETLAVLPLTSSAPTSPSAANQSPQPPLSPEPYTVLRNEISLSTVPSAGLEDSAAADFFSLDVGDDEAEEDFRTPNGQPELKRSIITRTAESALDVDPMLESGWFRGNSKFKSPMLQLHKVFVNQGPNVCMHYSSASALNFFPVEIVDFSDFLSPTLEEQASRSAAVQSVCDVIKYIWPSCNVEVFGSFRTGLYLPTSDIDVVILSSHVITPQTGLRAISRALSQRGIAKKILVIAKARVPIIKFVETRSGLSFDISFDVDNGPKAADFIKDAVVRWPSLRPLCLILKVFLQQRELNEVYTGGIGSYALLTMLMAALKNQSSERSSPEHNLGVLLVRSVKFMNNGRPFLISIEDPQTPQNDIGKNSFNYFQVRSAFAMAYSTLTNPKTIFALGPNRSILGTIIRPDAVLLQRKGGKNGDVTFNSLLPGAGEPLMSKYDHQDVLYNWQLEDDEEALPRGNGFAGEDLSSSGKKRKSSSAARKANKKRLKEAKGEEGSPSLEKGSKKKKARWRHRKDRMMSELHLQGKSSEDIANCLRETPLHPKIIRAIKSAHALG
ncbi:Terminal nucleotidyltransferase 4B [Linum grandiflorum]